MRSYRQGDVFLEEVPLVAIPTGATPVARDADGKLVIAHGERHGHNHGFVTDNVAAYRKGKDLFVIVGDDKPGILGHEEHDPIAVGPGGYRMTMQREVRPEEPAARRTGD